MWFFIILDTIESANDDDDIWPINEKYSQARGKAAIQRYIHNKWRLNTDWKYDLE